MVPFDPVGFARLSYQLNRERIDAALRRNSLQQPASTVAISSRGKPARGLRRALVAAATAFLPLAR